MKYLQQVGCEAWLGSTHKQISLDRLHHIFPGIQDKIFYYRKTITALSYEINRMFFQTY